MHGQGIGQGEQGAGVAGRDVAVVEGRLDPYGQLEQAHKVGHGGAALAHPVSHLGLGQVEALDHLLIGGGLFQGAKVRPLHVLHQGPFQQLLGRGFPHDDRHFPQPGQVGGPPAAFPGHQPEIPRPHLWVDGDDQGLDDAVLPDGGGKFQQGGLVELGAGLLRVGGDVVHGDHLHPAGLGLGHDFGAGRVGRVCAGDQRAQAAAKSPAAGGGWTGGWGLGRVGGGGAIWIGHDGHFSSICARSGSRMGMGGGSVAMAPIGSASI